MRRRSWPAWTKRASGLRYWRARGASSWGSLFRKPYPPLVAGDLMAHGRLGELTQRPIREL